MEQIQAAAEETKWYDAWIRWERGSKETYDDNCEEDDAPLVPTDTYSFRYCNVSIELQGFPSDAEAIWSSTGLTLWRSSEFLSDYLIDNKAKLLQGGARILELGAGLGRCGILARLLASPKCEVLLTDGDTDTLHQLRANVKRNHHLFEVEGYNVNISCHQLLWGEDTARVFLGRQVDTFDVIMGSDLVYVPSVIQPLIETVSVLLSKSASAIFVMAHCARREGNEVELEIILDVAQQAGLKYTLVKEEDDLYLYTFQWKTR
mmetsp:Transcript_20106/g.30236  ORF Transcript_20106/g.30236 Transcript_20106/m.30236 type:complete len:262 (-) Transcript_20106:71-856(-)